MNKTITSFLLVEDDDDHATIILKIFERSRLKNTITRVKNGEEAIAYLKQQGPFKHKVRPDVVLIDTDLPTISGIEVLKAIKSDKSLRTVPVVILATTDTEMNKRKAYAYNANSYLVKPIDFNNFIEMVKVLAAYWSTWNSPPLQNK